VRGDVDF
jgi:ATP-binding cassette subfamily F protein 2